MSNPEAAAKRILENRGEPVTFTETRALARAYQEAIEALREIAGNTTHTVWWCENLARRVLASAA